MAEPSNIIVELEIVGVDEFKKEVSDSVEESEKLEETFENIKKSGKSLKTQMRESATTLAALYLEINKLKDSGDEGSAALKDLEARAAKLSMEAGQLRDAMSDASQVISGAGSDTRGLDRALRTLTLFGGAAQIAEGASAAFGVESENLQKTLVRLNAVMAITNGLQQIQDELLKEDSVVTSFVTKGKQLYAQAVQFAAVQTKAMQLALAGLGIGIVVAAVGLLAANWDKVSKFLGIATDAQEKNNKAVEAGNKLREIQSKLFDAEIRLKKALGASEREILDIQLAKAKIELKSIETQVKQKEGIQLFIQKQKLEQEALRNTGKITEAEKQIIKIREDGFKKTIKIDDETKLRYIEAKAVVAELEAQIKGLGKSTDLTKEKLNEATEKAPVIGLSLLKQQLQEAEEALNKLVDIKVEQKKENPFLLIGDEEIIKSKENIEKLKKQIDEIEIILSLDLPNKKNNIDSIKNIDEIILPEEEVKKNKERINRRLEKILDDINNNIKTNATDTTIGNVLVQEIFGLNRNDFKSEMDYRIAVASEAITKIAGLSKEISSITSQFSQNIAEAETQRYENLRSRGLISERNYQRQLARIKNEQARKQRRAELVQAAVNIPIAILGAFTQTQGGIIIRSIAASVAGVFAAAQLAAIAKKPIPQFGGGGLFEGSGKVIGRSHTQGGVNASLEGGEYVHNNKAVQFYGLEFMEKVNKMKYPKSIVTIKDRGNNDYIQKALERSNYKLLKALSDKNVSIKNVSELAEALSPKKYV